MGKSLVRPLVFICSFWAQLSYSQCNTYQAYSNLGGGISTATYCTSTNMGAYMPGWTPGGGMGGGPSAADLAAKAAAEKKGICEAFKAGVPDNIKSCQADVIYFQGISLAQCKPSGSISWVFVYTGNFYKMSVELPLQEYSNYGKTYDQCRSIVLASVERTMTHCESAGQEAIQKKCN
ncbi:MAG TPA: hypothetical protein VL995_00675 [Cellvibrio sp.]|nr:hypothetical protein [Cellvibrio sp.]